MFLGSQAVQPIQTAAATRFGAWMGQPSTNSRTLTHPRFRMDLIVRATCSQGSWDTSRRQVGTQLQSNSARMPALVREFLHRNPKHPNLEHGRALQVNSHLPRSQVPPIALACAAGRPKNSPRLPAFRPRFHCG